MQLVATEGLFAQYFLSSENVDLDKVRERTGFRSIPKLVTQVVFSVGLLAQFSFK